MMMERSKVLVATTFLCLLVFPTTTIGENNQRFWPEPSQGWPHPSEISGHKINYGFSKRWKCTYSNGSGPAISISTPTYSTPSSPFPPPTPKTSPPPTPKKSPPPPTPKTSTPPPTPKTSPPPPTPSPPPPTHKTSPPPPVTTPSLPPPTPKKSPPPSHPSPTPKTSPPPTKPSPPPPSPKKSPPPTPTTPKKSPSPPPSHPLKPHPEHHHHHHPREYPYGIQAHIGACMHYMGYAGYCKGDIEASYYSRKFKVSSDCCKLIVKMDQLCDDFAYGYGFFHDPYFVPLVRHTCHVTYN